MDGVLVDPDSSLSKLDDSIKKQYEGQLYNAPGFFLEMSPMKDAIESFIYLSKKFDTYILTAAPWDNPTAANDKIIWVKRFLPEYARKRVIISHNKNLNAGDYLIDDNLRNGADKFAGKHIHFGSEEFPDWKTIIKFLDNNV